MLRPSRTEVVWGGVGVVFSFSFQAEERGGQSRGAYRSGARHLAKTKDAAFHEIN